MVTGKQLPLSFVEFVLTPRANYSGAFFHINSVNINTHGDCQGLKTSAVVATCHCKFGSPQPCWLSARLVSAVAKRSSVGLGVPSRQQLTRMGIDAMAIAEGYASSCPQSPAVLVQ